MQLKHKSWFILQYLSERMSELSNKNSPCHFNYLSLKCCMKTLDKYKFILPVSEGHLYRLNPQAPETLYVVGKTRWKLDCIVIVYYRRHSHLPSCYQLTITIAACSELISFITHLQRLRCLWQNLTPPPRELASPLRDVILLSSPQTSPKAPGTSKVVDICLVITPYESNRSVQGP